MQHVPTPEEMRIYHQTMVATLIEGAVAWAVMLGILAILFKIDSKREAKKAIDARQHERRIIPFRNDKWR
jgi:hypothetical protein